MLRLKELRKQKKLNQTQFARAFGVAQNTVSNWENGNRTLDAATANEIADFFGVSVDYLLGNEKKPTPSVDGSELSENEIEMLRRFRELSETQQDAVLEILKRS